MGSTNGFLAMSQTSTATALPHAGGSAEKRIRSANPSPNGTGTRVAGFDVATLDLTEATRSIIETSKQRRDRPLYFTSVNGEVVARADRDESFAALFRSADQILVDGQPLVMASRLLCRTPIPERVATTDLFPAAAKAAERTGTTFYMLGADPDEIEKAVSNVRKAYPRLTILGHSHGYLKGRDLEDKIDEINRLGPDILWLGLGVPLEQRFSLDYLARLPNVGIVKTTGGLFNFLSGKNRRAPLWMQKVGLEWLWRIRVEPRRLFWRYLTTNPRALYAILKDSA